MKNDRIAITSEIIETNESEYEWKGEASEKPKFMLSEEYEQLLTECAVNAVRHVCAKLGNGDRTREKRFTEYIKSRL